MDTMPPIQWDECETFADSDGTPFIRYAICNRHGIVFEMSMHDATIQKLVPQGDSLAVMSFPANNAKIDPIARGFTVLIGFGKPNHPAGNLQFMRLRTAPGFSQDHFADLVARVIGTLKAYDIPFTKHMKDIVQRN